MRILVIGSGGREHALAWALTRSPRRPDLFIAPGNAGTAALGRNVAIKPTDTAGLLAFARQEAVALTVVGPEAPLVEGLADAFEAEGLAVVGPSAQAARLEGSKAFAKAFMARHGVPTAAHRTFPADQYAAAAAYLEAQGAPVVVKASGLAAGKGALVCATMAEARDALDQVMNTRAFGDAGDEVVIEAFMEGEEASVFALTDGQDYALLAPAQDHKRIGEGDVGPNTGGMGAYAPAPVVSEALLDRVCRDVIEPTLDGMAREGHPYRGILYAGLMVTPDGPKVVEFNCRLGDPEAQIVLPLLDADLVEVFQKLAEGRLRDVPLKTRPGAAACVVMASAGYPGSYPKGVPITGLAEAGALSGVVVFHAGTRLDDAGQTVTAGGRVLGVTGIGADLPAALDRAYQAVDRIHFEGAQYRRDIGRKGLLRLG
jgi:phosphoribosylamine--glycine ligase